MLHNPIDILQFSHFLLYVDKILFFPSKKSLKLRPNNDFHEFIILFKKIFAIIIVAIEPVLAMLEAFQESIRLVPSEIINDGKTLMEIGMTIESPTNL